MKAKMDQSEIEHTIVWDSDIYGSLMNGNISRTDYLESNRSEIIFKIKALVSTADDSIIKSLLDIENWRAKTVAECLIGFKRRENFIDSIGDQLLQGCGGVTGYSYTLARFADQKSINYLIKYLNKYLLFDKFPKESFQDWGFSALRWIDQVRKTNHSEIFLGEHGLWTKFVNYEYTKKGNRKLSDYERWGSLEKSDYRFAEMMNFYKNHFEE